MLEYTLRKNKRAKYLRLRVTGDGRVMVSAPTWLGVKAIEQFIAEKTAWLWEKLEMVKYAPRQMTRAERAQEYLARKKAAQVLVEERTAQFNQIYQFPVGRITIRNQKTRWGSCSSQGNLSFNYRLLFLSPEEQDYIIVHELCHLQEMNHSSRFWALVERAVPEHRSIRRMLRQRAVLLG